MPRQVIDAFLISNGREDWIPQLGESLTDTQARSLSGLCMELDEQFHDAFPHRRDTARTVSVVGNRQNIPHDFNWSRCLRDCLKDRPGRSQCTTVMEFLKLYHQLAQDPTRLIQNPLEDEDYMNILITLRKQPKRALERAVDVAMFVKTHHRFRSSNIDSASRMFSRVHPTLSNTGPRHTREEIVILSSSSESSSNSDNEPNHKKKRRKDLSPVIPMNEPLCGKNKADDTKLVEVNTLSQSLASVALSSSMTSGDAKLAPAAATEAAKVVAMSDGKVDHNRQHLTRMEQLTAQKAAAATWTVFVWDIKTNTFTQPSTPFELRSEVASEDDSTETNEPDMPSDSKRNGYDITLSADDELQIQSHFKYQNTHTNVRNLLRFMSEHVSTTSTYVLILSLQLAAQKTSDVWAFVQSGDALFHATYDGALTLDTLPPWITKHAGNTAKIQAAMVTYLDAYPHDLQPWSMLGFHDSSRDITSHWEQLAPIVKAPVTKEDAAMWTLQTDSVEFAGRVVASRWEMELKTGMPFHKYLVTATTSGDAQSYSDVVLLWKYPDSTTPMHSIVSVIFSNDTDTTVKHRETMLASILSDTK